MPGPVQSAVVVLSVVLVVAQAVCGEAAPLSARRAPVVTVVTLPLPVAVVLQLRLYRVRRITPGRVRLLLPTARPSVGPADRDTDHWHLLVTVRDSEAARRQCHWQ